MSRRMVAAGRVIREKDPFLGDVVTCEIQYAHEGKILRDRQYLSVVLEQAAKVPLRSLMLREMFEDIARITNWE